MKYYKISEIANLEAVSQKFIRREIARKTLISIKKNNKYLVSESDYQKWKSSYRKQEKLRKNLGKTKEKVHFIEISEEMKKLDGWSSSYRNGYNFIDLFSGAGGLSCGLVMARFLPLASLEIMKQAVETYAYNFKKRSKNKELFKLGDIRDSKIKSEFYNHFKDQELDLIAGGFPCQGFSMAGNRVFDDPRNNLYLEMLDIVANLKPKFVLMENVQGLRTMLSGQIEAKIIKDFEKIGYKINVATLNSADFGVAQIRKRVIFIANRIGLSNFFPAAILSPENYKTLGQCIEKYMNWEENIEINHIFTKHSAKMREKILKTSEGQSVYKNYSDGWKKSPWDQPSCTVKENHGGVNLHPKLPRVLTPRELAALQSFPDSFIFKGSKKMTTCANWKCGAPTFSKGYRPGY
ncbi:DNA cytosine methyltransferase [Mesomycoplasma hyopneumoniae]|uniref:DNA cytosine methyltransferase n=1 Tax=Mesomycoplasma hyopneumoniae TaxID=2099 RepID=UPI0032AF6887